jgi:hypothetical protein
MCGDNLLGITKGRSLPREFAERNNNAAGNSLPLQLS